MAHGGNELPAGAEGADEGHDVAVETELIG